VQDFTVLDLLKSSDFGVDCTFEATLSTLSDRPMSFMRLVSWLRRIDENRVLDTETRLAYNFLDFCMELDPKKRCSATQALAHPFLSQAEEDEFLHDEVILG
jgi:serine/threonine protein kinase